MLRSLRNRFILSAIAAFFAVMFILVTLINIFNYRSVAEALDQTLSIILEHDNSRAESSSEGEGMPVFPQRFDPEFSYMTRFYIVRINGDGTIDSVSMDRIATVSETDAETDAKNVLSSGNQKGFEGSYRYMVQEGEDYTSVAFLNAAKEQEMIQRLLVLSICIALGSLAAVFVLVCLFSKNAIRPFENNIEKQKRFITDVSHELKTPLTSIAASADVIALDRDDEWIANIKNQTDKMSKMVSELVTLSRLDENDPLLNMERFSLTELSWEVAAGFVSQARAQEKVLDLDISDNIEVTGDKISIGRVLSILLDNALRYSNERGDIRLTVGARNKKAIIEVYNTCCYDEPLDTDRIFDRFYRPDESRNSFSGGSGIGLSIVRSTIIAHGGKIDALCPDGKSLTIQILL